MDCKITQQTQQKRHSLPTASDSSTDDKRAPSSRTQTERQRTSAPQELPKSAKTSHHVKRNCSYSQHLRQLRQRRSHQKPKRSATTPRAQNSRVQETITRKAIEVSLCSQGLGNEGKRRRHQPSRATGACKPAVRRRQHHSARGHERLGKVYSRVPPPITLLAESSTSIFTLLKVKQHLHLYPA